MQVRCKIGQPGDESQDANASLFCCADHIARVRLSPGDLAYGTVQSRNAWTARHGRLPCTWRTVTAGDELEPEEAIRIRVLPGGGHTPGSVMYYVTFRNQGDRSVLCGGDARWTEQVDASVAALPRVDEAYVDMLHVARSSDVCSSTDAATAIRAVTAKASSEGWTVRLALDSAGHEEWLQPLAPLFRGGFAKPERFGLAKFNVDAPILLVRRHETWRKVRCDALHAWPGLPGWHDIARLMSRNQGERLREELQVLITPTMSAPDRIYTMLARGEIYGVSGYLLHMKLRMTGHSTRIEIRRMLRMLLGLGVSKITVTEGYGAEAHAMLQEELRVSHTTVSGTPRARRFAQTRLLGSVAIPREGVETGHVAEESSASISSLTGDSGSESDAPEQAPVHVLMVPLHTIA